MVILVDDPYVNPRPGCGSLGVARYAQKGGHCSAHAPSAMHEFLLLRYDMAMASGGSVLVLTSALEEAL